MTPQQRNWRITVHADRVRNDLIVHRESFSGTFDEAVARACEVMGSDPRADLDSI